MHETNRHYCLPCIISIVFLIFNIFIHPSSSAVVDELYANCAPLNTTCGSSLEIKYPFWDGTRPAYCGPPGFALVCRGDSLVINIKNETFNVRDIDYESNTIRISKPPFFQGPCPDAESQLTNSSIDSSLFNYTSNSENATLFYNCQRKPNEVAPFSFPCPSNGYLDPTSTVFSSDLNFFTADESWKVKLRKICSIEIYIPVYKTKVVDLQNGMSNINAVVAYGFELKWTIDGSQCNTCLGSNGRCGYNSTLDQPICLCPYGRYNETCLPQSNAIIEDHNNPSKKTDVKGVGVAAAAVSGVMLVSLLCFLCYRFRNRRKRYSKRLDGLPRTYSTTLDPNVSSYFGVQLLSYSALEAATDYFNPTKELGAGGFGTVYHGILDDGREVAVKRLFENNCKKAEQFLNEVEILANLRHKNLVKLFGCTSRQSRELLLVYEYVPNGTVADHLHGRNANLNLLPWPTRLAIATESASALVYLHASDIIHRDVKTQNILLDKDFSVKVADFGLSRLFPLDVTHISTAPQGTPGYLDPEYHQCYQLTEKSDVYSFGVLLAELISSKPAVDVTRNRADINLCNMLLNKIQSNALDEFVDPKLGFQSDFEVKKEITDVAHLAFQCLQSTREMRPSMKEVLHNLYNIQDHKDKTDRQEVVDISDDAFIMKSDHSPASSSVDENMASTLIT